MSSWLRASLLREQIRAAWMVLQLLEVVLYNSNANYDKNHITTPNVSYLPAAAESPRSTLGIAYHEVLTWQT